MVFILLCDVVNMSELDDIAAAAGIVIIDTAAGDGGDADVQSVEVDSNTNGGSSSQGVTRSSGDRVISPEVAALDAMFSHRYTMDDPDYAETVNDTKFTSCPPCVKDYTGRRSRDDYRQRGGRGGGGWRGGGGGGYRRDHYNDDRSRDRGDYRSRYHNHQDGGDSRDYYRNRDQYRDRSGHRNYRDY